MIINTGNRTDIPAYFSEWFFNRIKDGYVYVRNPYCANQVSRYALNPDVVDCIAFCTKNPGPMLHRLNELERFRQFWFVTITPYGNEIEPEVPDKEKVIENFKKLSDLVGAKKVVWRYDPVFISQKYTLERHIENFNEMASELSGFTGECVISFIDLYRKTMRNFPEAIDVTKEERCVIGKEFAGIGKRLNIRIRTCMEDDDLSLFNIDCSGCMTQSVIERATGINLTIPEKRSARKGCDCLLGNDIGAYNTCGHGCIYCYANYDKKAVHKNLKNHNPMSPFLIGEQIPGDIIKDAAQKSFIDHQMKFF